MIKALESELLEGFCLQSEDLTSLNEVKSFFVVFTFFN